MGWDAPAAPLAAGSGRRCACVSVAPVPLALITGASTGIGRATSLRLARSGWTVLAGVRDPAAGESLAAEAAHPGRLLPLTLDITDQAQVHAAALRVAEVSAEGAASSPGGLDGLVNNAGVGLGGPLELLSAEDLQRQFDVNVFGQMAVTRALLGALRSAQGRIVFISSIGGRVAMAYNGPYAASKYAIEAFGDALRVELRSSGVQVALIEPGSVATPIWEKASSEAARVAIPDHLAEYYGHVPAAMARVLSSTAGRGVPPERVAETIEKALVAERMRSRYVIGRDAHAMLMAKRLLPDHLFDRMARRALGV